ncbi:MAG: hypothetical protein AABZ02_08445, partial [Bacteroidota bacterium]
SGTHEAIDGGGVLAVLQVGLVYCSSDPSCISDVPWLVDFLACAHYYWNDVEGESHHILMG